MRHTTSLHPGKALAFACTLLLFSCAESGTEEAANDSHTVTATAISAPEPLAMPELPDSLDRGYEKEVHFDNVRQLTYGGDNAEAYWSFETALARKGIRQPQA